MFRREIGLCGPGWGLFFVAVAVAVADADPVEVEVEVDGVSRAGETGTCTSDG